MAIFKNVISGLMSLILLVIVGGLILPSTVHVERSLVVKASPADIYPLVSDLNAWSSWSPWAQKDPQMIMTVTGTGVGQTLDWQSDDPKVDTGRQAITTLESPNLVKTHLDFAQKGTAEATFALTPHAEGTQVTWSLDTDMRAGVSPPMQPLSTYFRFMMDSAVGPDYETGLANLKALVEP